MQVTPNTFLPVLARTDDPELSADHLTDPFLGSLAVGYTPGPPYGRRLLTRDELGLSRRELRRAAAANLYAVLEQVRFHGQPPAVMLSLDGLESSALLAHGFWDELAESVPGELVVGAPARDVVIFTGADSGSGLRKVRRAVDRVFLAGGPHLLSPDLLVRRHHRWEVFGAAPAAPAAPVSPVPPPVPAVPSGWPVPPGSPAPAGPRMPAPGPRMPAAGPRMPAAAVPRQRMPRSSG